MQRKIILFSFKMFTECKKCIKKDSFQAEVNNVVEKDNRNR